MKTKTNQVPDAILDEDIIAQYLRQHPDFFVNRDGLLLDMLIPHQADGAVSLVERQVMLLREQQLATQKKLDKYMAAAHINDAIFSKSQKLILALIEATQPEDFFAVLEHSFRRDFNSSAYRLLIFDYNPGRHKGLAHSISAAAARKHIGPIMKRKKPTLGVLRASEKAFLFGQQVSRVQSAMVLSITCDKKPFAILAIGSNDKHYFSDNMDALFIDFIAAILSRLLPKHLT